jgi:hypothetical protein
VFDQLLQLIKDQKAHRSKPGTGEPIYEMAEKDDTVEGLIQLMVQYGFSRMLVVHDGVQAGIVA